MKKSQSDLESNRLRSKAIREFSDVHDLAILRHGYFQLLDPSKKKIQFIS